LYGSRCKRGQRGTFIAGASKDVDEGYESNEVHERGLSDENNESDEGNEGEQIAKGKRARHIVFSGKKDKTYTGLKKSDLIMNKVGKIVAKKSSAAARKRYQGSGAQKWIKAVSAARKQLNIRGFVALNSGPQGKALYAKAKSLYTKG